MFYSEIKLCTPNNIKTKGCPVFISNIKENSSIASAGHFQTHFMVQVILIIEDPIL